MKFSILTAEKKSPYIDWACFRNVDVVFQGISSMSDYAIGFHYTSKEVIYLLEYLVYHLRPYGVKFADLELNKNQKY